MYTKSDKTNYTCFFVVKKYLVTVPSRVGTVPNHLHLFITANKFIKILINLKNPFANFTDLSYNHSILIRMIGEIKP